MGVLLLQREKGGKNRENNRDLIGKTPDKFVDLIPA